MQDKTKTTVNDGGKSLGNVEESEQNNKNSLLIKRIPIGNSPLVIVGDDEQGWVVALGQYKISEIKQNETEAYEELQGENKWNTICNLITTIMEVAKKHETQDKENEKQAKENEKQIRLQLGGVDE